MRLFPPVGSLVCLKINFEPTLYDCWDSSAKNIGSFCYADLGVVLQTGSYIVPYEELDDLTEDLPKTRDAIKVLTSRGIVGWTHVEYLRVIT